MIRRALGWAKRKTLSTSFLKFSIVGASGS